jgi:hypothetical protein
MSGTLLFGQQIAFTSRVHIQAPVVIATTQESKTYGFESIELKGDATLPVRAVRFRVTFKTRAGEEVTDERRIVVNLEPRENKRVVIDLGHIEGLRQKAKSRQQESGLAILTVTAVEFEDGSIWEDSGPIEGTPISLPLLIPKK